MFDKPGSAFPGHSVAVSNFDELLRRLGLDLTSCANRLRALFDSPSSLVTEKTVTILSGATTGTVEHGLGQAYRGAVITSQSAAGAVYVLHPTSATNTVAGTQVTVGILVAPGADLTINLWIY